jgi:RND family efflux transporter MFP subunit
MNILSYYKYTKPFLMLAVASSTLSPYWAFSATFECLIEPTQTVDISSPVTGLLDKVNVKRGDKVHKGQIIATLESTAEAASAALARYKSEMTTPTETAANKVEFAKRKYERRRDMYEQNFMSAQDRDEAESELKLAQSELKQAQENKEVAKLEFQQQNSLLNLRTIRSPLDGIVVDQILYPGEVVEPSGQKKAILKLAQLNPLRVYVILPMAAFGKVKMGMKAHINPELPVGGHYSGTVQIIDRIVNAASGTFGVFLDIANPKLDIPAGVKCKAEFSFKLDTQAPQYFNNSSPAPAMQIK